MSGKKVLFFDMDDTLYRRSMPFEEVYRTFFGNAEGKRIKQAFAATQNRCEEVYFPVRRGEMTKEEGFIYRYRKGFADVGISLSAEEALKFRDAYQEAQRHIRADSVISELLPRCAACYGRIGVITNGSGKQQRAKLDSMELYAWIDPALVVISEEAGADKPAEEIFRCAETLAETGRENLVYVGDSPETDVEAARSAGWSAVLWDWDNTERSIREILENSKEGRC